MGKAKKTRKFAEVKRLLHPKDLKPCVFVLLLPASSGAWHIRTHLLQINHVYMYM